MERVALHSPFLSEVVRSDDADAQTLAPVREETARCAPAQGFQRRFSMAATNMSATQMFPDWLK